MEVVITSSVAESADVGADAVEHLLHSRPHAVLGLATGSSPLGVYDELSRRVAAGRVSLRAACAFTLDEYVGLPADHPQRYAAVIDETFTRKVDIDPARVHAPDGNTADWNEACSAYEQAIAAAGGVDLQILGIGTDGHIAFNEPGSALTSRTRIKTLTSQTRADNARFFGGDPARVPTHCLTQGIGTILDARHVILLAYGHAKAQAIQQMVEGPVSARWPATALQLHPHVTVIIDEGAASRLQLTAYYREAWAAKPD